MQLRYFKSTDLSGVYDLACRSLRENYNPTIFLDLAPFWREGLIVVEDMGMIVGFIFGIMASPIEARILMVAVSPDHRNRGLGTLLCHHFFQECAKKGVRVISLEVRESNLLAQEFYKKLGFQRVGIIQEYYSDKENGVAMQLYL